MDFSKRLSLSYYKVIATLNDEHQVYVVQHQETKKIYIKKKMYVYNTNIYLQLQATPIEGIPQIIELYEDDSSLTVIEEYISGDTLQNKINTSSFVKSDINYYINELCKILSRLHSLNPPIIHRDIKPSNIIIAPHNRVVLIDFNAAKYFTDISLPDTVLLGTKGYAAPEQYGFGSSTQQTDIYAIGVLLKELTSSLKIQTHDFDDLIVKCMQINPSDRFKSVSELLKKLRIKPAGNFLQIESWKLLIPPGFRTRTPWRMMLGTLGYLLFFFLCLTIEIPNIAGIVLWVERIFCLLMLLFIVFTSTNYLNIQSIIPLCKHKNRIIHYFGIILLDIMFITMLTIFILIIESFL